MGSNGLSPQGYAFCGILFILVLMPFNQSYADITDGAESGWSYCRRTAEELIWTRWKNFTDPTSINRNTVLILLGGGESRAPKAAEIYHRLKPSYIITTGHNGQDRVMANELIRRGVPADKIILEPLSANTRDHVYFVNEIIHNRFLIRPHLALITSKYHVPRAEAYFDGLGFPFEYSFGSLGAYNDNKSCLNDSGAPKFQVNCAERVLREAKGFADAKLCWGIDPNLKRARNYKAIAAHLRISSHDFRVKCAESIDVINKYGQFNLNGKLFCNRALTSNGDPNYKYTNLVQCLTLARNENFNHGQLYYHCLDDILADYLGVHEQYIQSLVRDRELFDLILAMTATESARLRSNLAQLPIYWDSNRQRDFVPYNSELLKRINHAARTSTNGARIVGSHLSSM